MNSKKMVHTGGSLYLIVILISGYFITSGLEENGIISEKDEKRAGIILDKGNEKYESKEWEEAIDIWEKVIDDYQGTTSWPKAVFNTGLAYEHLEEYETAIDLFKMILNADVNNLEEGGYVMEAYRNYHHKSCMEISWCYKVMENYENALEHAYLAKDVYVYETWCGTCAMQHEEWLRDEITYLELMVEWTENKEYSMKFQLTYRITSPSDSDRINITLPMPEKEDGDVSEFWNRTMVKGKYAEISLTEVYLNDTISEKGLNISFIGSCSVNISMDMGYIQEDEDIENIFNGFTLDLNDDWEFLVYCDWAPNSYEDMVILELSGSYIRCIPESEFRTFGPSITYLNEGGDHYYLFESGYW